MKKTTWHLQELPVQYHRFLEVDKRLLHNMIQFLVIHTISWCHLSSKPALPGKPMDSKMVQLPQFYASLPWLVGPISSLPMASSEEVPWERCCISTTDLMPYYVCFPKSCCPWENRSENSQSKLRTCCCWLGLSYSSCKCSGTSPSTSWILSLWHDCKPRTFCTVSPTTITEPFSWSSRIVAEIHIRTGTEGSRTLTRVQTMWGIWFLNSWL